MVFGMEGVVVPGMESTVKRCLHVRLIYNVETNTMQRILHVKHTRVLHMHEYPPEHFKCVLPDIAPQSFNADIVHRAKRIL